MNNTVLKTIGKYAIILTVFYAIDIALGHYTNYMSDKIENYNTRTLLVSVPMIVRYVLNIVTAIIISFDKTKLSVTGKYAVLLTIFHRPIGIVIFLIYLINSKMKSELTHNMAS